LFFENAMTAEAAKQLSPLTLAYIGDAVYELMVREHLLISGKGPAGDMHKTAVGLVCACAQCTAAEAILPLLNDTERSLYLRGRNAKPQSMPKNADVEHYRKATGLECLWGYLYLTGDNERLKFLFSAVLNRS